MNDEPEAFELEMQDAAALADTVSRGVETNRWPAVLRALLDVSVLAMVRANVKPERAEVLARAVVAAQAFYVGGRNLYLPAGEDLKRALMYDEIFHAARSGNYELLARQYKVTPRRIAQIVREQTLLRRAKMQGWLFPEDEGEA
jgi:Mor family transcriptional regulator